AAMSRVLVDRGCNIEDVSATILRGHGAVMMIVQAPASEDAATLDQAARSVLGGTGVSVNVQPCVVPADGAVGPAPTHVLSVYGTDRPGIVHRLTALLAERGVNITDLDSRLVGRPDRPIYAMLLEMQIPPEVDVPALKATLNALGKELSVDISLREV